VARKAENEGSGSCRRVPGVLGHGLAGAAPEPALRPGTLRSSGQRDATRKRARRAGKGEKREKRGQLGAEADAGVRCGVAPIGGALCLCQVAP
jgi:hypothetical protein